MNRKNEQLLDFLDKKEIDLNDEIAIKKNELNILKRSNQEVLKKYHSLDVYDQFIDTVQAQQKKISDNEDENVWNKINEEMDKELKSLEMVQLFIKRNKSNELKKIEIDESALIKANDILKHFCDQK